MTRFLLIILLLTSVPLYSQLLLLSQPDSLRDLFSKKKVILSVEGQAYQQSNAVTNSFVNKFINGGFIDNELKSKQRILEHENLFNASLGGGISIMIAPDSLFGTDRYGWIIGIHHFSDLSTRFTKDAFNTVFYGNKMYAGQQASFANTGIRYQQFQQLRIGFFDKKTLSNATVGFIHGNSFADLTLADSELYTESTGDYIELAANGRFHLSDTANTKGLVSNGIGATIGFELNLPVHFANRPDRPSYVRLGARNVGFVRWSNNTVNYRLDTTYTYQGFLIDDLANVEDWDVEQVVDSLVPDANRETYYMTTPGWFFLSWYSPLGEKLSYELAVRSRVYSFHLPEVRADLFYRPDTKIMVGVNATYGGYGGYQSDAAFRAGISLSARIGTSFMLNLESRNVTGWFSADRFGRDVFVKLSLFL